MIKSMTGYGDSQGQLDGVTYVVEIRTVNSRYFKAKIKLPDSVAFVEEEVEKLLRKELLRGTVSYVLHLKDVSVDALINIDEQALKLYLERLGKIADTVDIKGFVDIGGLLTLPGVIHPISPEADEAERIRRQILDTSCEAVEKVKLMRSTEGVALATDLEGHCESIRGNLKQIRSRSGEVVVEYKKKLEKRINELLCDGELQLDESTLSREVAVFAERSDISEEIARLESHLQQFSESCQAEGQAGRKLDFISQEMLREANTIASKASDTEIIRYVVDIKCRIDRIKEQVQNIE